MTAGGLRVGILADSLGEGGGIARYVEEIVRGVAAHPDIALTVFARVEQVDAARALAPTAREVVAIGGRGQIGRSAWEVGRLGGLVERLGIDVVHGTKHVLPRTSRAKVLTAHDVTVLTHPEQFPVAKRLLVPRVYRWSLREADVVIAVSETTRHRLVSLDPALGDRVIVVPNGTATEITESASTRLRELDGRSFALVVGDLSPRKNLSVLLDIWDEVWAATGWTLAVVGPDGWRSRGTRRRLERLVRAGQAVRPGRVSDAELRWCYEHAETLLYPSLEEGFGLPVVEALALGTPVIATTDAAVVEVGAGVPRHVDPRDRAGWCDAITDAARSARARQARVGPEWARSARLTVEAYQLARVRGSARARS